jgi:2,4-dienoyl-CoA reductase-like NADH-dependent reductase (Old Yellow Enzyme family)
MSWERTKRRELYETIFDYVRGRPRPRTGPYSAAHLLEGLNRSAAHAIRYAIKDPSIKILCTGAFQTLQGIRQAITAGDCDAVTMARPLLANPDLPCEILAAEAAGRDDYQAKEPCSLCNRCLLAAPEFPVGCLDDRRYVARYSDPSTRYDAMIHDLFALYR